MNVLHRDIPFEMRPDTTCRVGNGPSPSSGLQSPYSLVPGLAALPIGVTARQCASNDCPIRCGCPAASDIGITVEISVGSEFKPRWGARLSGVAHVCSQDNEGAGKTEPSRLCPVMVQASVASPILFAPRSGRRE